MPSGTASRGWRLRVVHTTRIGYPAPVRDSFNEVRMTPLTLPCQVTLESRVLADGMVPARTYRDYWGNEVSVLHVPEPHSELLVRAEAIVETSGWSGRTDATGGRAGEFLRATPLTRLGDAITAGVLAEITGRDDHETAQAISAAVHERIRYVTGATGVRTDAEQAWRQGRGVCQDLAHATVALMRAARIPARYVSGYLHADPGAVPGQTSAGQSHAWVEYWAGEWVPCDPTTGAAVRERHVVVARGRDYADVPPLRGIYHGPPESTLSVGVEVTRLA